MGERATVTIIGGGMVGISFALALRRRAGPERFRIRLIESFPLQASDEPVYTPSFDARSTALSWGSVQILQDIHVWPRMAQHAAPIHCIHVSQAGRWGANRLRREDAAVDALGQVVENQWIGASLASALADTPDIEIIAPATVAALEPAAPTAAGTCGPEGPPTRWTVRLCAEGGADAFDSDLVIVADGGRSALREQLGFGTRMHDYRQHAVICNLRCEKPHRQQAYERFTENGPLALLPLPDDRMSLVWSVPPDEAPALAAADDAAFIAALQRRFGYRLGRILQVGRRASYPLQLEVADAPVRAGLLLLGNAAHTLHPIAGQGFNLSMRDVDALAHILVDGANRGIGPGSRTLLDQYLEARREDQQRTLGLTHGLNLLFSNLLPGLSELRSAGMVLTEILPGLRDTLARQAMGVNA